MADNLIQRLHVEVDRDRCIASGMCEQTCPEVFEVDAEGLLQVLQPEPDRSLLPLLKEAERGCPSRAIAIRED